MSSSSSSKRHSLLPSTVALPKAPVRFPAPPQTLTIAESAILTGSPSHTITLGADAVVHPRARLDSSHGPVTVGRRCIISERCVVGAASASDSSTTRRKGGAAGQTTAEKEEDEDDVLDDARGVILGDYVRVDVGAVVEAGGTVVGDGCVLGVGARVGRGAVLGKVGFRPVPHTCQLYGGTAASRHPDLASLA